MKSNRQNRPLVPGQDKQIGFQKANTLNVGIFVAKALKWLMVSIGVVAASLNLQQLPSVFGSEPVRAASSIAHVVNYQGRLLGSGGSNVPDGNYSLTFRIYSTAQGGSHLWSASTTNGLPTGTPASVTVAVKSGLFSILLGDASNGQVALPEGIFNNESLYLGVKVGSDSEMTPRKRLSAVPYAYNSETLQGQYASHTVSNTGGNLFALNQTSADGASANRTAFYIKTAGTSNQYDYLMRANNGSDVFSINRQGSVTTTGNLEVNGVSILGDNLASDTTKFNSKISSDFLPATTDAYYLGNASNRWKGITVQNATTTNATTTNLYASGNVYAATGIRVGTGVGNVAGSIRFDGTDFTGYDGTLWRSMTNVANLSGEATGFPNRTDSTISFNDGTRTFTIAPTGASFDFYYRGSKFTKSTAQTVVITATEGEWIIYFDGNGTLQASQTKPTQKNAVYVAAVYWDNTNSKGIVLGEERHGLTMDADTHSWIHNTIGTRYNSGLTLTGTTAGTGNSNVDAQVSVANGSIFDEDIRHDITYSATPSLPFEQNLGTISGGVVQTPALIPVYYRSGASGVWRKVTANSYPVYGNGTGTPISYNNPAGPWTVPPATSGYFVATWLFATNNINEPVIAIVGQRQDNTLTLARSNNTYEGLSFGALPVEEAKVLYRVIYETKTSFTNAVSARIVDVQDLRSVSNLPGGTYVATAHSALSGLTADDHTQYFLLGGRASGQIAYGGINASENLTLDSTGNVTKGKIIMQPGGGAVQIGSNSNQSAFTLMVNGHTGPSSTNSYDLGSSALRWRNLYAQGNIYTTGTILGGSLITFGNSTSGGNIIPTTNNTYSLGSTSNRWLGIWAKGVTTTWLGATTVSTTNLIVNGSTVYGGTWNLQRVTNAGYVTNKAIGFAGGSSTGDFLPTANNTYSLGSTSYRWLGMWAKGVTSTWIGATTVSSTNIYVNGKNLGNAFILNGNRFGTTATLGTNDAQSLAFETNNATRMTIDSNGKVGFGITPDASYVAKFNGDVKIGDDATTLRGLYFGDGNFVSIKEATDDNMEIYSRLTVTIKNDGAAAGIVLNDTGNVGIGVASPTSFKLQVAGSAGPNANNSYDLGSSSLRWRNLYASGNLYATGTVYAGKVITFGNSTSGGSLSPSANNTYSLGSTNYRWLGVWAKGVTTTWLGATTVSTTNLVVNGSQITADTLQTVTNNGVTTNKWIQFAGATSTNNFRPGTTNSYDLGSSSYRWRNLYAQGNIYATGTIFGGSLITFGSSTSGGNIIPTTNNTYSLGSTSNRWLSVWAKGVTTTWLGATTVSTTNLVVNGGTVYAGSWNLQRVTNSGYVTNKAIGFAGGSSTGDFLPTANNTYSLGNTSYRWLGVWAKGVTSTWIGATTVSTTNLVVNGQTIGADTLQTVTNNGKTTTKDISFAGGTSTARFIITGSKDQAQFTVRANGTQTNTNPLIKFENSAGTQIGSIHADGVSTFFAGINAGRVNTAGSGLDNYFVGNSSGYSNTTGDRNIAIGSNALYGASGSSDNIAIGYDTAKNASLGASNIAIGNYALRDNTSLNNTAIGYSTLIYNTGSANTGLGYGVASNRAGSGYSNTAVGDRSMFNLTSGYENVALGQTSLYTNQSGYGNVAIGKDALYSGDSTSFKYNTAVGYQAANTATSGGFNTALGSTAMTQLSSGSYNAAVGNAALGRVGTGSYNAAVGANALWGSGGPNYSYNSALGYNALYAIGTGSNNTAIGYNAGVPTGGTSLVNESNNTFLGTESGMGASGVHDSVAIGYYARVNRSNSMVLGGTGGNALNVGIGTTYPYAFALTVAGHVGPSSTNLYDLGSSSLRWRNLFATKGDFTNVSTTHLDALHYVSTTNLYVNGTAITGAVPTLQQVTNSGYNTTNAIGFAGASSTGNFLPTADYTYNLGSASKRWLGIWVKGVTSTWIGATTVSTTNLVVNGQTIVADTLQTVTNNGVTTNKWIQFAGATSTNNFRPGTTNSYDLGSSSYRWRNLYAQGNIYATGTIFGGSLVTFGNFTSGGDIIPVTNNTYSLGSTSNRWLSIWAKGVTSTWVGATTVSTTNLYVNGSSVAGMTGTGTDNRITRWDGTGKIQNSLLTIDDSGNLYPSTNNAYSLGTATNAWRNIYTSSTIYAAQSSGYAMRFATSGYFIAPGSNNSQTANFLFKTTRYGTANTGIFAVGDHLNNYGLIIANATTVGIGTANTQSAFVLTTGGSVGPSTDLTYDLGSLNRRWRNLYSSNVSTTHLDALHYVSTTNLYVNGTQITGNGLTGSGTDNRITRWNGTSAVQDSLITIDDSGNLYPSTNLSYDLGTSANRWDDIWASSTHIGNGTWDLKQGSNGRFAIAQNGGTEKISVLTGGNVGIGTTTPIATLEVINSGGNLMRFGRTGVGYYQFGVVGGATHGDNADLRFYSDAQGGFSFVTNSGNKSAMNINNSGQVGIGSTSPEIVGSDYYLTVAGGVAPSTTDSYYLGSSSYRWLGMYAKGVTSTWIGATTVSSTNIYVNGKNLANAFINNGNSFAGAATLGTNDSNALNFETANTNRMTISSAGNISITGELSDSDSQLVLNDNVDIPGTGYLYNSTAALTLNDDVQINNTLDVRGMISDGNSDLQINDNLDLIGGYLYDSNSDLQLNDAVDITGNLYDSNSDLTIADTVIPSVTDTYSLGTSGNRWLGLYAKGVTSTWVGATTVNTTNLYVNGTQITGNGIGGSGTDNRITRWNGTSAVQDSLVTIDDSGNVYPSTNNSYTLGTPSNAWRNIYASSTIYAAQNNGYAMRFATSGYFIAPGSTQSQTANFLFKTTRYSPANTGMFAVADHLNNYALVAMNATTVGIGTANTYSNAVLTTGGSVAVIGNGDRTQFTIKANATQSVSSPLLKMIDSSNNEILRLSSNDGSNVFLGANSGHAVAFGSSNTFVGSNTGYSIQNGSGVTAIGNQALYNSVDDSDNIAIGTSALFNLNGGISNVTVGNYAGYGQTTASNNTIVGHSALSYNKTGYQNTAIGNQALGVNAATDTVAIGMQAGYGVSGQGNSSGVFVGNFAGYNVRNGANSNTFIGSSAGQGTTIGNLNVAVGYYSLGYNTTGYNNAVVGANALYYNRAATNTTALGNYAGYGGGIYSNQAGVYIGNNAGRSLATGSDNNTMVGFQSGYFDTTGHDNTYLGYQAGSNITTGNNNIAIGSSASLPVATASNQLNIGNTIYGNLSSVFVGVGTTTPIARMDLTGSGNLLRMYRVGVGAYRTQVTGGAITGDTADLLFVNDQNGGYLFNTNSGNTNALAISNAGYVGIGDTSPASPLSVGNGDLFQVNTSGYALHPAGSNSTPSVSFVGDPDTGMYNYQANTIGFAAGGGIAANIDRGNLYVYGDGSTNGGGVHYFSANNNFNINLRAAGGLASSYTLTLPTSSPGAGSVLQSDGSGNLSWNTTLGNAFVQNGNSFTANATLGTNDAFALNFETGNVTRMTIDANGYFGIGITPSTSYKLQVDGGDVKIGNTAGDNRKLYFGDGTYAYIGEQSDDYMRLHGSQLNLNSSYSGIILDSSNLITASGTFMVKGHANEVQFVVQGGTGQTNVNPLLQLKDSAGTVVGAYNSDDVSNIFLGANSGYSNTDGGGLYNTFMGSSAGYSNTTADSNTAIGYQAGYSLATLNDNTFLGYMAGYAMTDSQNTMIGSLAGRYITGGNSSNTGVGYHALFSNSASTDLADYNTAIGAQTLEDNSTGNRNTAVGGVALSNNTTGYDNVAVGTDAMQQNLVGFYNTALGFEAMKNQTSTWASVAIGMDAMRGTAGLANSFITYNNAIGMNAMLNVYTGSRNNVMGYGAADSLTTGDNNTAIGHTSMQALTSGTNNTSLGTSSMYSMTTGANNIALGISAMYAATLGDSNIGIGEYALTSLNNSAADFNVAVGDDAGSSITSGHHNVAIGPNAGKNLTTGYNNTFLGFGAGVATTTGVAINNAMAIGYKATATSTNQIRIGNGLNTIYTHTNIVTDSDIRLKKDVVDNDIGLNLVRLLKPKKFHWKYQESGDELQDGLIAQEVVSTMDQLGIDSTIVDQSMFKASGGTEFLGMRYEILTIPLINAVKEIDQRTDKLAQGIYISGQFATGTTFLAVGSDGTLSYSGALLKSQNVATSSTTSYDSGLFTLQGSAWVDATTTAITTNFKLFNHTINSTSSEFVIGFATGTNQLSERLKITSAGDVYVSGRLYLASKRYGTSSSSTYIFVDDTLAPTSTYIATNADGWMTSSTYDYAERYESKEELKPGDLVTTDANGINLVKRASSSNQPILGIVSTRPGFVTGGYQKGNYPIALAGRVPTRVSTVNGAINVGDYLTASDVPGVAVKAISAGNVVGVALESYSNPEEGLISVFVKPSYQAGIIGNTGTPTQVVNNTTVINQEARKEIEGLALITMGAAQVHVSYGTLLAYPMVYATPHASLDGASWWIANRTDTGFDIMLDKALAHDIEFTWMARPMLPGTIKFVSDNTYQPVDNITGQMIGPVNPETQSTDTTSATTTTPVATTTTDLLPGASTSTTNTQEANATSTQP